MYIDVTGLKPKKSRKATSSGFKATYYYDSEGLCVAKECSTCEVLYPREAFTSDPRNVSTGLMSRCRSCHAMSQAERGRSNPRAAEDARRVRARNGAQAEADVIAIRSKKYPDGVKGCSSCGMSKPLHEFGRDSSRCDWLRQRCKLCANDARDRKRKRVYLTYWMSKGIPLECYICSGPYEEVEHVWCKTSGGPDVPENTLPSCWQCNRGPGGKWTTQFFSYVWDRFPPGERGRIINRVALEYGVWPFDQPYVAEDWA